MRHTQLLIGFLLIALLETADAGKRYAVVVGVRSYRPNQPLPELLYTENDASQLASTLKAGGYQVTLMTQSAARIEGNEVMNPICDYIRDQIDAVVNNPFLDDDDVVIVALAGHGVQYEQKENVTSKPHFYFCAADADVRKLRTDSDVTERSNLIDLEELYGNLKKCKAGGKLLLVDACRNDPTKPSQTRTLASNTLPPLPPPPGGTAAFFSCSAHQRAYEDADLKHGVFFHQVIQALNGAADSSTRNRPADGRITLAELAQHVSLETYDFVRTKFRGAKQAPELKGEFRLTVPLIEFKAGGDSHKWFAARSVISKKLRAVQSLVTAQNLRTAPSFGKDGLLGLGIMDFSLEDWNVAVDIAFDTNAESIEIAIANTELSRMCLAACEESNNKWELVRSMHYLQSASGNIIKVLTVAEPKKVELMILKDFEHDFHTFREQLEKRIETVDFSNVAAPD